MRKSIPSPDGWNTIHKRFGAAPAKSSRTRWRKGKSARRTWQRSGLRTSAKPQLYGTRKPESRSPMRSYGRIFESLTMWPGSPGPEEPIGFEPKPAAYIDLFQRSEDSLDSYEHPGRPKAGRVGRSAVRNHGHLSRVALDRRTAGWRAYNGCNQCQPYPADEPQYAGLGSRHPQGV